jgi:hypothetical protein
MILYGSIALGEIMLFTTLYVLLKKLRKPAKPSFPLYGTVDIGIESGGIHSIKLIDGVILLTTTIKIAGTYSAGGHIGRIDVLGRDSSVIHTLESRAIAPAPLRPGDTLTLDLKLEMHPLENKYERWILKPSGEA